VNGGEGRTRTDNHARIGEVTLISLPGKWEPAGARKWVEIEGAAPSSSASKGRKVGAIAPQCPLGGTPNQNRQMLFNTRFVERRKTGACGAICPTSENPYILKNGTRGRHRRLTPSGRTKFILFKEKNSHLSLLSSRSRGTDRVAAELACGPWLIDLGSAVKPPTEYES